MTAYLAHTTGRFGTGTCTGLHGTGRVRWGGSSDDKGNREYTIVHRVRAEKLDGPWVVSQCTGLPQVGDPWQFPEESQSEWDFAARCQKRARLSMYGDAVQNSTGDHQQYWDVEQYFSTRHCEDVLEEDPLQMAPKISGSFSNKAKEVTEDFEGNKVLSSSFELIHGPQAEFDFALPKVTIEVNQQVLPLAILALSVNKLNLSQLWGLAARCIRLSNAPWSRTVNITTTGALCDYYFTVTYEFDIDYDTFDKFPIDEGTKIVKGKWSNCTDQPVYTVTGDPDDPRQFIRARDCHDEITNFLLDGNGAPLAYGAAPSIVNITPDKDPLKPGVRRYGAIVFPAVLGPYFPGGFPGNATNLFP